MKTACTNTVLSVSGRHTNHTSKSPVISARYAHGDGLARGWAIDAGVPFQVSMTWEATGKPQFVHFKRRFKTRRSESSSRHDHAARWLKHGVRNGVRAWAEPYARGVRTRPRFRNVRRDPDHPEDAVDPLSDGDTFHPGRSRARPKNGPQGENSEGGAKRENGSLEAKPGSKDEWRWSRKTTNRQAYDL